MRTDTYLTRGASVVFRYFSAELVSLAGVQPKTGAKHISGRGVVHDVWADDPVGKKNLRFNVEREDGTFIEVPAAGVVAVIVLQEDGTSRDVPVSGVDRIDP